MILTGDFNSKIASKIVEKKRQIKTKKKTKKNRQNLIDFCTNHKLMITSTCTKTHLITWKLTRIINKRIQNLQKNLATSPSLTNINIYQEMLDPIMVQLPLMSC